MLTESRQQKIIEYINKNKIVTVEELTVLVHSSESTIRRDLQSLSKLGKIRKVHGGATIIETGNQNDEQLNIRQQYNKIEKNHIGQMAASLLEENDFVYIDAGTTTESMIDYIQIQNITFVTNGILQAQQLLKRGYRVFLLGGELKPITEAIIGEGAITSLQKYNFTKGFLGTNGVSIQAGFTTPEMSEAIVKQEAMKHCMDSYVLMDASKFEKISAITFGAIEEANIITNVCNNKEMKTKTKIIEVKEK
ncbi:MAG: DeoR/GlpR family DNA-binding transcription regulator [Coprobacillaceae bacterium]